MSSITPATTSVQQGSSLSFSYVIKNQGNAAAGLNYEAWQVDSKPTPGNYLGWDTDNSLAANATVSFNDSVSTANLSIGTHTLWVGADTWSNVAESDETNNWTPVSFDRNSDIPPSITAERDPQPKPRLPFDIVDRATFNGDAGSRRVGGQQRQRYFTVTRSSRAHRRDRLERPSSGKIRLSVRHGSGHAGGARV